MGNNRFLPKEGLFWVRPTLGRWAMIDFCQWRAYSGSGPRRARHRARAGRAWGARGGADRESAPPLWLRNGSHAVLLSSASHRRSLNFLSPTFCHFWRKGPPSPPQLSSEPSKTFLQNLNPQPSTVLPGPQPLNPTPGSGPRLGGCEYGLEKICFFCWRITI